ncbi:MAG: hypothetical protein ACRD5H_01950 [Nitrososphaerales archaeon]
MRQSELQRLFREIRLWIAIPAILLLLFSYGTAQAAARCHVNGYVMAITSKVGPNLSTHDQIGITFVFFSSNPSRAQWYTRDFFIYWTRNHNIVTLAEGRIANNLPIALVGEFDDGQSTGCGSGPGGRWGGEIIDSLVPLN